MSTIVLCDHEWRDDDGTDHQCALDDGHPEPHNCGDCHVAQPMMRAAVEVLDRAYERRASGAELAAALTLADLLDRRPTTSREHPALGQIERHHP